MGYFCRLVFSGSNGKIFGLSVKQYCKEETHRGPVKLPLWRILAHPICLKHTWYTSIHSRHTHTHQAHLRRLWTSETHTWNGLSVDILYNIYYILYHTVSTRPGSNTSWALSPAALQRMTANQPHTLWSPIPAYTGQTRPWTSTPAGRKQGNAKLGEDGGWLYRTEGGVVVSLILTVASFSIKSSGAPRDARPISCPEIK